LSTCSVSKATRNEGGQGGANAAQTAAAPPKVETPRDWTNIEGKTIRATLVEKKDKSVMLKLESGKTVEYPLDKLSAESKAMLVQP